MSAVGDSGLCKLAKGASAPLLFLNLGYCDRVSDVGLSTVLLSCPSLRSLNIEFCRLISDKGVAPIARFCGELVNNNINKLLSLLNIIGQVAHFLKS